MSFVSIFILYFVVNLIIGFPAVSFFKYSLSRKEESPTLSREQIKEIYKNNPERIELWYDGTYYLYINEFIDNVKHSSIHVNVSFKDWFWLICEYGKYNRNIESQKIIDKREKTMEKIEKLIQSDKH